MMLLVVKILKGTSKLRQTIKLRSHTNQMFPFDIKSTFFFFLKEITVVKLKEVYKRPPRSVSLCLFVSNTESPCYFVAFILVFVS